MTTLPELIEAVKEDNLSKDQLESYRNTMSNLFAKIKLETAGLEKEKAMFMFNKTVDESVANRLVTWKATQNGLRLIELDNYCRALKPLLDNLKARLYSIY